MIRRNPKNGNKSKNPPETKEYWWEARASAVKEQGRDEMTQPTSGSPPKFRTPEDLWQACCEYFKWVEENPLYTSQVIAYKGRGSLVKIPKMRAMTINGLALFLGMRSETWWCYKTKKGAGFNNVCTAVEQIIRDQKFSGASADLLNASIIARDLGLKEGHEHSGPNGGPIHMEGSIDPGKLSDRELMSLVTALDKAQASQTTGQGE